MPDPIPMSTTLALQAGSDAGQTPLETVPLDGTAPESIPPAEQNTVLLVALPILLLVVGAITYLAKRRPASAVETGMPAGEKGGLVLMGVGALLTGLILVYLMLAQ